MFYYGRIVLMHLDKLWGSVSVMSTVSLDDGYCEATIPIIKRHHMAIGGAHEVTLASSTISAFYMTNTNRVKWKISSYNCD